MKEAALYKKLDKKQVKCSACARRCKISDEQSGFCGARKNIGGKLYLLVHYKAIAAQIDPIEKKPLYHFLPGSKIFSLGTLGCNFRCGFCQNFEMSQVVAGDKENSSMLGNELTPKKIADYCRAEKIQSIAFTYNEPAIFSEYAAEVMNLARKYKMKGVFVSNGYETPEALDFLADYIDAYNIDLKAFSENFYQKICQAKLGPVLETIKEIYQRKKWLEITTLLVPGKNDSVEEIRQIAEFIKNISPNIPWHISAFYPIYKMTDIGPTADKKLIQAHEIGKRTGLKYVYLGNIDNLEYDRTVCPKCGTTLIDRDRYKITVYKIKNGNCLECGIKIPGVWD